METKNNEIDFQKTLNIVVKSSLIVFLGIFSAKILTYIYKIIIARYFGPETYGLFTLAFIIVEWSIAVSSLGLNKGLIRYVSILRGKKKEKKISSLFKFSFKTTLIFSFSIAILIFLFSDMISNNIFKEPGLTLFLVYFAFAVVFLVITEILLSIALGYERVGWYNFIHKILRGSLQVSLLIFFIFLGLNSYSVILSYFFALTGILIASFLFCIFKYPEIFKEFFNKQKEKGLVKELFSYSWPLLFYGFVWEIFLWTDSFMIGYFKTSAEVGIYNAAIPLAFLLPAVSSIFIPFFFPMINREYSMGNKEKVKQLSKQIGKWVFFINLPVFILFIIFPGTFLNILFGSQYFNAELPLKILAFGALFYSIFIFSNQLVLMKGKSRVVLKDLVIAFLINLTLNWFLVPRYGIVGASVSTAISLVIISLIFAYRSNKYLSIVPIRRKMLNLLGACILSALVLYIAKLFIPINILSLILLAIFFLLLYTFLSFLFKAFDNNDKMILRSFLKKSKKILFIPNSSSSD